MEQPLVKICKNCIHIGPSDGPSTLCHKEPYPKCKDYFCVVTGEKLRNDFYKKPDGTQTLRQYPYCSVKNWLNSCPDFEARKNQLPKFQVEKPKSAWRRFYEYWFCITTS